ncbi:MAG: hypothetical protein JKY02_10915 [Flavobacteriaceae bacterium]|nr:hypothetical protein [Flavobacteriaceae bacterium]
MKQFIYSILFVFTIQTTFSQSEELVLKKSFNVDKNTILNLDVDNVTIQFVESTDDKIHLDYSIVFNKDSEEFVYRVFNDIKAEVFKDNNIVTLDIKNSMFLGELYTMDVDINTYKKYIAEYFKQIKQNKFLYKSKDSLLREINSSSGPGSNDYFKKLKRENPNKNFGERSRRFKQKFIIKAPKYLKIKIKALHSRINFNYDISKPIELNSFKTYLKFKNLESKQNKFSLHFGIFQSKKVVGGTYFFKDVNKVSIGSISDVKLDTETSKIQIGEICKNVRFNDFNSKLNFYNFSKNFTSFNFVGDYSELSFYDVKKNNYSMDVFGFNTALFLNKVKTTFGNSKEKKLTKILEKKAKNNNTSGKVKIELKNGILNIIPEKKE